MKINFSNVNIYPMVMFWIIIMIMLIMFFVYYNRPLIEGYDARLKDTGFDECAKFCRTTANCRAFGYDKINKICYPSQVLITGRPLDSIFRDEYLYTNASCNKEKFIENPAINPSFEERRSNSVFACTEDYKKAPQFYLYNKDKFKNIGEGKNIDEIFDIDVYEVNQFSWPRNNFGPGQDDLYFKTKENETYNKTNITDLNRIIEFTPTIQPTMEEIILPPKINQEPELDFGINKAINKLNEFVDQF